MPGQHIENLFRRFKGEVVDVKTVSGGIYSGRISEVTNDYVCLTETRPEPGQQVYRSEEHTSELQSHRYLHSSPPRRSSDLVKTVSGGIYSGRISEVTNDYVCLTETRPEPGQQVY